MNNSIRYPHIAARLFNTPLMVLPEKLDAIILGLSDRLGLHGLSGIDEPSAYAPVTAKFDSAGYRVENSIALIDVNGVLAARGGMNPDSSRMTAYSEVDEQLQAAIEDHSAKAIALIFNSPGGEVTGSFQLMDSIKAAKLVKPVHAIANDLMSSAAYLVASAATSISATPTARVGSIGVLMQHIDMSAKFANDGLKVTQIYAGKHKVDGNPYSPLTDEVKAVLQESVDYTYGKFVDAVAMNRGISRETVIGTEAAVFNANKALDIDLIDRIETVNQMLSRLSDSVRLHSGSTVMPLMVKSLDLEEMKAKVDALESKNAALTEQVADLSDLIDAQKSVINDATAQLASLQSERDSLLSEKRDAAITALAGELNKEFSEDQKSRYRAMKDDDFKAMAADLIQFGKPALPTELVGEVAVSGKTGGDDTRALEKVLFDQVAGLVQK